MVFEIIGSVGVGLLLVAFALNVAGKLSQHNSVYLILNIFGASLAAWYAAVVGAIPFLILESVWAAVAALRLIRSVRASRAQK